MSGFGRAAILVALLGASVAYSTLEGGRPGLAGSADRILALLSSPTYLVFVISTGWFTHALIAARSTRREPRLVRLGSYRSLLARAAADAAGWSMAIVGIAASAAFAAGFVPSTSWIESGPATRLGDAGVPEGAGVAVQITLVCAYLITWRVLIECLSLVTPSWTPVVLSVAVWLWAASSASGFVVAEGVGDFTSYVVAVVWVGRDSLAGLVVTGYLGLCAAYVFIAANLDRTARGNRIEPAWRLIVVVFSAMAVALGVRLTTPFASSPEENVALTFVGATGTVLDALLSVVVVLGYAFAAYVQLAGRVGGWEDLALIRHGSRARQIGNVMVHETAGAVTYSVFIATVAFSAASFTSRLPPAIDGETGLIAFQLVVAQTAQIVLYVVTAYLALLLTRDPRVGLAILGVWTALAMIPMSATSLWPVQRSGTAVVLSGEGGWALASSLVVVLSIAVVALALTRSDQLRDRARSVLRHRERNRP